MLKKILKKTAMYILIAISLYLVIGYFLHLVVFPENKPEVATYFKPGQQFYSKHEGFRQTVQKQENGYVYCSVDIEPFAGGPPKHIHTGFDETFEVKQGELSVWMDGKVFKLRPGDTLHVPKGVPHKPYNETADTVTMNRLAIFPEKFAYHLTQAYGLMDDKPDFGKSAATVMQMSLLSSEGFDSYLAEGPPVPLQKTMSFLLTPLTRLLGYRSFYPKYDIRKQ
jgi:mannose-6-phosphate isomerase-like protein (cupin superfamily)